jgi:hypothetical protein
MDVPQLKLLAGLVRGLLAQNKISLGHSQALDVVAALPGLRNWSEVMAFPKRVADAELNSTATSRLGYRLKSRFQLELEASTLLEILLPAYARTLLPAPEIWPSGPRSGVYIATSKQAINKLLAKYSDATDGALVYAERAGSDWEGSIDLSDYGLWSHGLERVPSGTLLVLGPLHLDQQSWDECASKLEMACNRALVSGHRVAVLMETPMPDSLLQDVKVAVTLQPGADFCDEALVGVVSDDGDLLVRTPFAPPLPRRVAIANTATPDAIPPEVMPHLLRAIGNHRSGILVASTSDFDEHPAIDIVASLLAVTKDLGMPCRIMPRERGTPAKDFMVPEPVKALPFMPSVQAAYAQGYRRMIVSPHYTDLELLAEYASEVLFICGTFNATAADAVLSLRARGPDLHVEALLAHLIACFAAAHLETKGKKFEIVYDMFIGEGHVIPPAKDSFSSLMDLVEEKRVLRWEDRVTQLLKERAVSLAEIRRTFRTSDKIDELVAARKTGSLN